MHPYTIVFLLSMIKFILGPISGIQLNLSWTTTAILTVLGSTLSSFLTIFFGKKIKKIIFTHFNIKRKKFTKRNRRIIIVWKKYGVYGISFLTPLLLTPIGGALIIASFGLKKKKYFLYLLLWNSLFAMIFSILLKQIPSIF